MVVRNSLAQEDIGDVLEWLQAANKTGALALESATVRKKAFFIEGAIAGIESNEPCDSLAHRLRARGLLTQAQIESALFIERSSGRALLDVLNLTGAVAQDDIELVAREQALEALWSAFLWVDGTFAFMEDELPENLAAAVSLEVGDLLAEGRRRRKVADELRADLPHAEAAFLWTGGPFPARDEAGEQMLAHLSEPRTLNSLQLMLPATEWEVLQRMSAMVKRGEVFVAEGEARVAAASVRGASTIAIDFSITDSTAGVNAAAANSAAECVMMGRIAMEDRRYEDGLTQFGKAAEMEPNDARIALLHRGALEVCAAAKRRELTPAFAGVAT